MAPGKVSQIKETCLPRIGDLHGDHKLYKTSKLSSLIFSMLSEIRNLLVRTSLDSKAVTEIATFLFLQGIVMTIRNLTGLIIELQSKKQCIVMTIRNLTGLIIDFKSYKVKCIIINHNVIIALFFIDCK